jgi:cytochrome P450
LGKLGLLLDQRDWAVQPANQWVLRSTDGAYAFVLGSVRLTPLVQHTIHGLRPRSIARLVMLASPRFHLRIADERFRSDPYAVLADLRERAPVHYDEGLVRYIFTRHADVQEILRDREFWSDPRKANPGTFSREILGARDDEEPSMLLMHEPGHRRLRALVSGSFTPAAVDRWRPRMGFNPFATAEERAIAEQARAALDAFFASEIAARRVDPGDDLISDMLQAEADRERPTETEMIRQCNLLLVAGNVTTTDLIGNSVKALLDHPEQMATLRGDPGVIRNAVEEMLRFDSPVVNSGRIANRDVALGGCPVRRGESLSTSLAAANRDPTVYPDPDTFRGMASFRVRV